MKFFRWGDDCWALLRAKLDAYYDNLFGPSQDELRYVLDPKEVYGKDFSDEIFCMLKE